MFISDKFKFSNNKFIKILQKFVLLNSILAFTALIFYLFGFSILNTIFNDPGDSAGESGIENKNDSNNNKETNKNEQDSLKNKDVVSVRNERNTEGEEYYNFNIRKDIVDNTIEKAKELLNGGLSNVARPWEKLELGLLLVLWK